MKKIVIGVVVLVALAGCNTFKGLGEDIQKGGKAIEKAATK
ncbi:MAG: entericidin A/B family lipoprotein [Sideroxyarcus sp.]|nr:entericidin A/B family lipoprotein [Sideroxyarcus sp.]